MEIEDIISEGDKVFARATLSGTQTGDFMGIPATSKSIKVPMGDYLRVAGGKVVEHWGVMDSGLLAQQMGVAT